MIHFVGFSKLFQVPKRSGPGRHSPVPTGALSAARQEAGQCHHGVRVGRRSRRFLTLAFVLGVHFCYKMMFHGISMYINVYHVFYIILYYSMESIFMVTICVNNMDTYYI